MEEACFSVSHDHQDGGALQPPFWNPYIRPHGMTQCNQICMMIKTSQVTGKFFTGPNTPPAMGRVSGVKKMFDTNAEVLVVANLQCSGRHHHLYALWPIPISAGPLVRPA